MLYTRKGDGGESGLFGTKERFSKNSVIYDALGTLDELNSLLGVCRARVLEVSGGEIDVSTKVKDVQENLFIIQAELAGADKTILQSHTDDLEKTIDEIEKLIVNQNKFVISGSTEISALFDYARAVSRRAERVVISAENIHSVSPMSKSYLNRLSSLLFALARYLSMKSGAKEESPGY